MNKTISVLFAVLIVGVLSASANALSSDVNKALAKVRQATHQYHDMNVALTNGYVSTLECVSTPAGGMGVHYVNEALMGAGPDITHPDVLLYEPKNDGSFQLAGVEYVYPAELFESPPMLFGMPMDYDVGGNGDLPFPHYERHVYLWQANPTGIFMDWNPNVKCPVVS